MKGRKHYVSVNAKGLIIGLTVHRANIQDRDGVGCIFEREIIFPGIGMIWADGVYAGQFAARVRNKDGRFPEIAK